MDLPARNYPSTCQMSHVTCHMSCVTFHVSHATMLFLFWYKVVKLVCGGCVIIGAYPVFFADPDKARGCSTNSLAIH